MEDFYDLLTYCAQRLRLPQKPDNFFRLFSQQGEEIYNLGDANAQDVVFLTQGEEWVDPSAVELPMSVEVSVEGAAPVSYSTTPVAPPEEEKAAEAPVSEKAAAIPSPLQNVSAVERAPPKLASLPPVGSLGDITRGERVERPVSPLVAVHNMGSFSPDKRAMSRSTEMGESSMRRSPDRAKSPASFAATSSSSSSSGNKSPASLSVNSGLSYAGPVPVHKHTLTDVSVVTPLQAQHLRAQKSKAHVPNVQLSVVDKAGAHILLFFHLEKKVVLAYRNGKLNKDLQPWSLKDAVQVAEFGQISSFNVSQTVPERTQSSLHLEHHVSLYSGTTLMYSFRLMHVCQLDPLSDLLRCIVEGSDVAQSYHEVRPNLCIRKGPALITRQKKEKDVGKESEKGYIIVNVRTVSIFNHQNDTIPLFVLPLPACELKKKDTSVTISVVVFGCVPEIRLSWDSDKVRLWE